MLDKMRELNAEMSKRITEEHSHQFEEYGVFERHNGEHWEYDQDTQELYDRQLYLINTILGYLNIELRHAKKIREDWKKEVTK